MKPTQFAELLSNIKATIVSFFSILMFVALGVGIFTGMYWMAPALEDTVEKACVESSLHDFQIAFPYGLTDSDLEQLRNLEGVSDVEPGRQSFQVITSPYDDYNVKVQSVAERINTLKLVKGALPAHDDEIVMTPALAASLEASVGDTITFEADATSSDSSTSTSSSTPMRYLTNQSFKLVGLMQSAEYLACSTETYGFSPNGTGTVHGIAWVPINAFKADAFYEGWPIVNVRYSSLEGLSTFSKDYKDRSNGIKDQLDELGSTLAAERYASIHSDAQAKIDDGEKKLADARTKIKDGEEKLASGKKEAEDGAAKIADGEAQLQTLYAQIASGEAQFATKYAEYEAKKADADKQLAEGKEALDVLQESYDEAEGILAAQKALNDELQARNAAVKTESARAQALCDELNAAVAVYNTAIVDGVVAENAYWDSVYPPYVALQQQIEVLNGTIAAFNATAEAAAAADPDLGLEASLPLASSLPNLPEAPYGTDSFESARSELEGAASMADTDLTNLNQAPVTVDGTTVPFAALDTISAVSPEELAAAEELLAAMKAPLDAARTAYEGALAEYNSKLASANEQIAAGQAKLDAARAKAAEGEAALAEARAKLADGQKQLEEKEAELEDAKSQLKEKEAELEDAKEKLGFLKKYRWAVSSRVYNGGIVEASTFAGMTDRLSYSMAALFVVVGLLVSYSAVSRIVHEQIVQIGTKKALGLRFGEITTSFLLYSALAVVLGAIAGLIVGIFIVEGIVAHSVGARFTFDRIPPFFDIKLALLATALELALVLAATWLACRKILLEQAVELLKGEKPPEGKERFFEKWPVWDRLPLYTQTIISNCFNDKRRVFSTVVGVAGCTSLVVTALTLNNDVLASYDKQYENVYGFDAIAYVDGDTEGADDAVVQALSEKGASATPVLRQGKALSLPTGEYTVARILVPEDPTAFLSLYHVNSRDGSTVDLSADGVWITEAYASHVGAQVGDTIAIDGSDGARYELPIAGFYEFYIAHNEIVMGQALYERIFGSEPTPNAVFINSGDSSFEETEQALQGIKGYLQVVNDKLSQKTLFIQFANVARTMVLVYLSLSVVMAVVVLLNLNVMFIEEKKRDLIVLMINGFSVHDAKRYIYQDTILLTIIGIIFGMALGAFMGSMSVASLEPTSASFFKGLDLRALLAGLGTSAVLSFLMSLIALRRIPRFKLTDINKL